MDFFGFLVVAGLSTMFVILFHLSKIREKRVAYNLPPGPKGLPITGNLHQFGFSSKNFSHFYTLGKTYGPILMLRLIGRSMVVIQSAKLAKEVMHTNDMNICDRPITTGTKKVTYNLLDLGFSPYTEYLKEMKKILSAHFLSPKNLESFAIIKKEEVSRLIQNISSLASASKLINLNELVITYASSAASRLSFGKSYNKAEGLGAKYHRLLHEAEEMFTCFFYNDYIPVIGNSIDKLIGKSSRLERIFKELDAFYELIINDHLHANNKRNTNREDAVDFLLRLMNDTSFPFRLTIDNIKAILLNLFVAGANSPTALIIWAVVELLKNPISMRKVQEELRNVAPKKDCTLIEESELENFPYFKAVVKETFRLHPPAPLLIPRKVVQKCVIGGYDVLPQTTVYINAWAIGRDREFWKDPEKFMPERFLLGSLAFDAKGLENYTMIPFGRGRRMCPAYSIGVANLEVALANLLCSFNWELPPSLKKEDIDDNVYPGVVTHKRNNLYLVANHFK